jgi:hypothetical protein
LAATTCGSVLSSFGLEMNTALRTIVLAVLALLPTLIAGLAIR